MKKNTINGCVFGMAAILFSSSSIVASPEWNHSQLSTDLYGQGSNGQGWASFAGASNDTSLNLPYAECGIGGHQSPIAINLHTSTQTTNPGSGYTSDTNPPATLAKVSSPLKFQYIEDTTLAIYNSGHAVQVNMPTTYTGNLLIGNDAYPLVQFHFHTPSEHTVITEQGATKQYAGELHFVHQRSDGKIVVLAVFLDDTGAETKEVSNTLNQILPNVSTTAGITEKPAGQLNPMALLPKGKTTVFTYAGSLTTPPCSEGVNWYVLSEPIQVSPNVISTLQSYYNNGNRVTQNTLGRVVETHKGTTNNSFFHDPD